jgi:hypothetical protein
MKYHPNEFLNTFLLGPVIQKPAAEFPDASVQFRFRFETAIGEPSSLNIIKVAVIKCHKFITLLRSGIKANRMVNVVVYTEWNLFIVTVHAGTAGI